MQLGARLPELPTHSREAVEQELATLDFLETQIDSAEHRLEAIMKVSAEADLLKTTLFELFEILRHSNRESHRKENENPGSGRDL